MRMRVRIVHPEHAAGLRDPHTKRSPFIDPETKAVVEVAEVPDDVHWNRRLRAGEVVRVVDNAPTGREPVAPLTTRGK